MEHVYKYLNDISHNRKKLHTTLAAGFFLVTILIMAILFEPLKSYLEAWGGLDIAKNSAISVMALLGFIVFVDYKNQTHSVSKTLLTKSELLEKYSAEKVRILKLGDIQLQSIAYHFYDRKTELTELSIYCEQRLFQIPWYLEQYCKELIRPFNPARVFNGKTLRFEGFRAGKSTEFQFSYSTYFDYLISNGSHDQMLFNQLTVRDLLEPGPRLSPLDVATCSNHLGLSAIFISCDGYLLLQKRSKSTAVFSGRLSPSVSGAANVETFSNESGGLSFLTCFITEMQEELSSDFCLDDFTEIRVLGVTRELVRLGKPELFLIASMKASMAEINQVLHAQTRNALNMYGSLSGTGIHSPSLISRSEAEMFLWLKLETGESLLAALQRHGLQESPDGRAVELTINGCRYAMSESLAANLSLAVRLDACNSTQQSKQSLG